MGNPRQQALWETAVPRPAKRAEIKASWRHTVHQGTKQGRVFICRLFQRSYYDEHSSSENTIQWTFLLLSGSPLSFLFTFVLIVLWCPLRSCCTFSAFSKSKSRFPERLPFETYLSTSSSTVWSVRWSEKGLFHPCSHPALFRFPIPIMSGFYSSGAFNDLWLDPSKYPKLWFITSHYVLNCGKYSIVTVERIV